MSENKWFPHKASLMVLLTMLVSIELHGQIVGTIGLPPQPGELFAPDNIEHDTQGNIYLINGNNNGGYYDYKVLKFNSTGDLLTEFGPFIGRPSSIAVDGLGNLFLAQNYSLLKYNSSGALVTSWDVEVNHFPESISVDGTGNLYVYEEGQRGVASRVQKFSNAGTFITEWNVSVGNVITTDPTGDVFILTDNAIDKYNGLGQYLGEYIGNLWDPVLGHVVFDIHFDASGNIYLLYGDHIAKRNSIGSYLLEWNTNVPGDILLVAGNSITVDVNGDVLMLDAKNFKVKRYSSEGIFISKWGKGYVDYDDQIMVASRLATDSSENVFVFDVVSRCIKKFTKDGDFILKWGGLSGSVNGITCGRLGNVYVSDGVRIKKFTNSGAFILEWGSSGAGNGQFNNVTDLAVDAMENVYVSDYTNGIQKFSSSGNFISQWSPDVHPKTIAIDSIGNVYTAGGAAVLKYNGEGVLLSQLEVELSIYNMAIGPGNCIYISPGPYNIPSSIIGYNENGTVYSSTNIIANDIAFGGSGRMYVASQDKLNGIPYGAIKIFETIQLNSFVPSGGLEGSTISMYGKGFGSSHSDFTVTFNGVKGELISNSGSTVDVKVPVGGTTGKISIITPYSVITSQREFVVLPIEISSIKPNFTSGNTSTMVIHGSGFSSVDSNNLVSFNNEVAGHYISTSATISGFNPGGYPAGKVSVAVEGFTTSSRVDFDGHLAVHAISPTQGEWQSNVMIACSGLGSQVSDHRVMFNGLEAEITELRWHEMPGFVADDTLIVTVPKGVTTGDIKVLREGIDAFSYVNPLFEALTSSITEVDYLVAKGSVEWSGLLVSPNPVHQGDGILQLKANFGEGSFSIDIGLYDVMGRRVMETTDITLADGEHLIPWAADFSAIQPGIYFLKIRALNKKTNQVRYARLAVD